MEDDPFSCFDDDNEDDPFSCFDDGSADEEDETTQDSDDVNEGVVTRDPGCGVLAFHAGTEQALLRHLELEVAKCEDSKPSPPFILDKIDEFCLKRHWMMHVGAEKGKILRTFLRQCCEKRPRDSIFRLVELGTYLGYASILLATIIEEIDIDYKIVSVEVVEENARIARTIIDLAGLTDKITVLVLDPTKEALSDILQESINSKKVDMEGNLPIDFLFVDHDKSLYKEDLQQLEAAKLIRKGTSVAADNVVFAQIDDYRDYMKLHAKNGIVETRLELSFVEYSELERVEKSSQLEQFVDGIELSTYEMDPMIS